jgi:hypothetical protein
MYARRSKLFPLRDWTLFFNTSRRFNERAAGIAHRRHLFRLRESNFVFWTFRADREPDEREAGNSRLERRSAMSLLRLVARLMKVLISSSRRVVLADRSIRRT